MLLYWEIEISPKPEISPPKDPLAKIRWGLRGFIILLLLAKILRGSRGFILLVYTCTSTQTNIFHGAAARSNSSVVQRANMPQDKNGMIGLLSYRFCVALTVWIKRTPFLEDLSLRQLHEK